LEDRESRSKYHDQGVVELMLLLLAGFLNLLSNLLESVGDVRFLGSLINVGVDKAMDSLEMECNGRYIAYTKVSRVNSLSKARLIC